MNINVLAIYCDYFEISVNVEESFKIKREVFEIRSFFSAPVRKYTCLLRFRYIT